MRSRGRRQEQHGEELHDQEGVKKRAGELGLGIGRDVPLLHDAGQPVDQIQAEPYRE